MKNLFEWIEDFHSLDAENGKKLDLKTKILDVNNLSKKATAEDYQNIVVMNDWFDEIFAGGFVLPKNTS